MNPQIERFLERPLTHRLLFWVVSLACLYILFWQYLYADLARRSADLREKRVTLSTRIATEQRLARNLDRFKAEVRDLEVRLKFAVQELPDSREIPDLLASISNLARDAGLEVSLFRPSAEIARDFYSDVPVAVAVEGTFHQVATFFDEVGNLSRIVNIRDISIREPQFGENPGGAIKIKAECTATTFRYLDESERMAQVESGEEKPRRRR